MNRELYLKLITIIDDQKSIHSTKHNEFEREYNKGRNEACDDIKEDIQQLYLQFKILENE